MAVHPKSENPLKQYKGNEIDIEREWKTLQNILKSEANESLGTTKRRKEKIFKNLG